MSEQDEGENLIRRILIALDASPHSLAALQAAAELAALLDAELEGLYVEDIDLLRTFDLPFTREVSIYSTNPPQVTREHIELQLRAQANQARRALRQLSERTHLKSHFKVVRGRIVSELLQAATDADLIIIGKAGWSHRNQLGSTARVVITQAPRYTLVLQHGTRLGRPLAVLYDGSEVSKRALAVATSLVHEENESLFLLIKAKDMEQTRQFQEETGRWLRNHNLEGKYRWLLGYREDTLHRLVKSEAFGALVVPVGGDGLSGDGLAKLLNETRIPVLLVR